jgi:hypothetical protein
MWDIARMHALEHAPVNDLPSPVKRRYRNMADCQSGTAEKERMLGTARARQTTTVLLQCWVWRDGGGQAHQPQIIE